MAAFSDQAFDTNAFSIAAFDFGSGPPPPPTPAPTFPIGGGIPHEGRSKRDISKARKRLGLEDAVELQAQKVILAVAQRQAQSLELDAQKRFEELERELKLERIEWEGRFLERLNAERERLIAAEIAARIKARLAFEEEEMLVLLMLMAAAAT